MSNDFLSKFSDEKYSDMLKEDEISQEVQEVVIETPVQETVVTPPPEAAAESVQVIPNEPAPVMPEITELPDAPPIAETTPPPPTPAPEAVEPPMGYRRYLEGKKRSSEEDHEIDTTYKARKRKQYIIVGGAILLLLLLSLFLWDRFSHTRMPDFVGKNLSEARTWAAKYNMLVTAEQAFSLEQVENNVMTQDPLPDTRVKKGSEVSFVVSKGPDPDERITLPDFENMTFNQAVSWVEENKAYNVNVFKEFNDEVPADDFIKLEFRDKTVTADTYVRKNSAMVYYSRGVEVFEKNITVPDFLNKPTAEAENWARTNELKYTIEKDTSNTVAEGLVSEQSVPAGQKVAKKDPFVITESLGKAIIVPNYARYSAEEAATIKGLTPVILQRYSSSVPYGFLVSQSLDPGTELTQKDNAEIVLTYSLGRPYLKDLRGTVNEGELQKYIYDEFQSKGANITYDVYYVKSSEPRGTVVKQSNYGVLLTLRSRVSFGVSRGGGTGDKLPGAPDTPEMGNPDNPDDK